MLALSALIYTTISVVAIYIGKRSGGMLSWGSLLPMYFLFMLLIFPLISYINGAYASYIIIPTEQDTTLLYWFSTIAITAFIFGYILLPTGLISTDRRSAILNYCERLAIVFRNSRTTGTFLLITAIAGVWSISYGYFGLVRRDTSDISASAGLIGIISTLMSFVNIIVWTNRFDPTNPSRTKLPWISLLLIFIFAFASNSKGALIFPFVHILLAYYFSTKRVPIRAIFWLFLFFFLFAYPLVQGFRFAVLLNVSDQSAASMIPQLIDYMTSLEWIHSGATPEGDREAALGRGIFAYLAYIYKVAGVSVPYLHGKTYMEGLENLVPRFILPDKVDMNTGNWTGQLFDHVSDLDPITNVSPSFMGEFYMNHGLIGLIVGMILLGIVSRMIDRKIFTGQSVWLKVLFVMNILWLEAFVGTTFLVFIKTFITFILLTILISKSLPQRRAKNTTINSNVGSEESA